MENLAKEPKVQVDGKFYEKCPVVMLPTEKASNHCITKSMTSGKLFYNDTEKMARLHSINEGATIQHLYFTTDEEIKEGDYVLVTLNGGKDYHVWLYLSHNGKRDYSYSDLQGRIHKWGILERNKIVASTDESLDLPRPSNEFLKKFCELNGIQEVLVQVIQEYDKVSCETGEGIEIYYRLKVAPDNTITIKPVQEEKLYTRDEVEILLKRAFGVAKSTGCYLDREQVKDWIKENL